MGVRTWRTKPSTQILIWIRVRWCAVTLQAADLGDTATLDQTLSEAGMAVAELA